MTTDPDELVAHFFRHEYGRLVASLVGRFGTAELAAAEDAAQNALLAALTTWGAQGLPKNPSAWLQRVALNELLGMRRTGSRRRALLDERHDGRSATVDPDDVRFSSEVDDELLRMLFVCCDERLPERSRLVLALKTLCGFGTGEIATRLFTSKANVHKRLQRARARLRGSPADTQTPAWDTLRTRLPSVRSVIYLVFDEGYLSSREQVIRAELCAEALRLGELLAGHSVGAEPETFALVALMHLHASRLTSRQDPAGELLLLEEQDRAQWDRNHLAAATHWLERASTGAEVSRYHLEAAIAAEHAFSPSFGATDWKRIARYYQHLERIHPSPLHALNRALALADAKGPNAALALLEGRGRPSWLAAHYLWDAALADLHRRAGDGAQAAEHRKRALAEAPSAPIRRALARRLFDG